MAQGQGSTELHQQVVKRVLMTLSLPHCRVWANATGVAKSMTGERVIRYGLPGSSDILGIYKGVFLGVEIKTGNAKQNEQQEKFQRMVDSLGAIYVICRDTDIQTLLQRIEDAYRACVQERSESQ